MMDPNGEHSLVEEREEVLINLDKSSGFTRKGWFIKPSNYILRISVGAPFLRLLQKQTSDNHLKEDLKMTFKGWSDPTPTWVRWVNKLRPIFQNVWKKAGILDAILVSTNKVHKDFTTISEVLPFWTSETNTFMFPSEEVTVTLEDVMVLGGFSPIGHCARGADFLTGDLEKINLHLVRVHKSFNKMKTKKANYSAWIRHFMDGNDGLVEHVAFLSLWLSKYVFPKPPGDVVQKNLFPIAILMAQGEKFALGPAVLASLYRDMRLLKEHLSYSEHYVVLPICIWAPFQFLQMWIWEHFVSSRQNACPKLIDHNQPWATRWHNLVIKKDACSESIVKTPGNFQWRPYAKQLDNWSSPTYYRENGQWISINDTSDEGIISFAQCLRSCELVGLDSIQLYLPHRVSRQFGYDQDLQGCGLTDSRISDWEVAWSIYKKDVMNCMLFVPARDFSSDVTYKYHSWWKENISPSSHPATTVEELMKDAITVEKISNPMLTTLRSQTDLITTPLDLNDMPLNVDSRCNVRFTKGLARMRQAALSQNKLIHHSEDRADFAAAGEDERTQHDWIQGHITREYKSADHGAKSSTFEDPRKS